MDPNLTCIDPNLLQLLEEDDDVPGLLSGSHLLAESEIPQNEDLDWSRKRKRVDTATEEETEEHELNDVDSETPVSNPESETFLVNNMNEALLKLHQHQQKFNVHFRKHKFPKLFGQTNWKETVLKKKLYLDQHCPYIKAANDVCIYECHQGPDHDAARKEKRKLVNNEKNRKVSAKSKKVGCPARAVLEERIYFHKYKVGKNESQKANVRTVKTQLKKAFSSPESIETLDWHRKIWLRIGCNHNHYVMKSASPSSSSESNRNLLNLDVNVVDKIHEYVWKGLDRPTDIRNRLLHWIWSDHSREPFLAGRTMINKKDLLNHVARSKQHVTSFNKDQEEFQHYIENLQGNNDDFVFFRPHFHRFPLSQSPEDSRIESKSSSNNYSDTNFRTLQKEGTVFLVNEENSILAFGRKVQDQVQTPPGHPLQWFEITEAMMPGLKTPYQENVTLEEGALALWPNNLVLDVMVETLEENKSFKVPDTEVDLKNGNQPLLYVFQSQFQSKLLREEKGSEIFFLDTICRAIRSNLIFYLLWIKTRVDYQPIAFIVTEDETKEYSSLVEALQLLSHRNETWKPKYCFLTPDSNLEKAVEKALDNCTVFHDSVERVRIWDEWFSNNESHEALRSLLDSLATVQSLKDFNSYMDKVSTYLSKNSTIEKYWRHNWLDKTCKWAYAMSCIRSVVKNRPRRVYLSLHSQDSETFLSHSNTFRLTRRLFTFSACVRTITEVWVPSMKESHVSLRRKLGESKNEMTYENDKSKNLLHCLRQIIDVFSYNEDTEGIRVCNNIMSNVISDMIPLLPDHDKRHK